MRPLCILTAFVAILGFFASCSSDATPVNPPPTSYTVALFDANATGGQDLRLGSADLRPLPDVVTPLGSDKVQTVFDATVGGQIVFTTNVLHDLWAVPADARDTNPSGPSPGRKLIPSNSRIASMFAISDRWIVMEILVQGSAGDHSLWRVAVDDPTSFAQLSDVGALDVDANRNRVTSDGWVVFGEAYPAGGLLQRYLSIATCDPEDPLTRRLLSPPLAAVDEIVAVYKEWVVMGMEDGSYRAAKASSGDSYPIGPPPGSPAAPWVGADHLIANHNGELRSWSLAGGNPSGTTIAQVPFDGPVVQITSDGWVAYTQGLDVYSARVDAQSAAETNLTAGTTFGVNNTGVQSLHHLPNNGVAILGSSGELWGATLGTGGSAVPIGGVEFELVDQVLADRDAIPPPLYEYVVQSNVAWDEAPADRLVVRSNETSLSKFFSVSPNSNGQWNALPLTGFLPLATQLLGHQGQGKKRGGRYVYLTNGDLGSFDPAVANSSMLFLSENLAASDVALPRPGVAGSLIIYRKPDSHTNLQTVWNKEVDQPVATPGLQLLDTSGGFDGTYNLFGNSMTDAVAGVTDNYVQLRTSNLFSGGWLFSCALRPSTGPAAASFPPNKAPLQSFGGVF